MPFIKLLSGGQSGEDIELAFADRGGEGPPLLLLHGLTANQTSFDQITPHLLDHYRIYTLDHRGHGLSSHCPGEYSVELMANDAACFIRKVIGEPVLVLGHSMGACVTLILAATGGNLIRAIVLEDPPLESGIPNQDSLEIFEFWQELGLSDLSEEAMVERLVEKMGDDDMEALRYKAKSLRQMDISLIQYAIDGNLWSRARAMEQIRKIHCPAYLLQADPESGGLIDEDLSSLAELQAPNWTWKFYPEVGHNIHGQISEGMAQDVHVFLKKVLDKSNSR